MSFSLRGLHPQVRAAAEAAMQYHQLYTGGRVDARGRVTGGTTPTVTSGFRDLEKQAELYRDRANNPYPVNRPGDSAHNYGLAFDSDVPDPQMALWIGIRRAIGFRVPENDEVHAEVEGWRSLVGKSR